MGYQINKLGEQCANIKLTIYSSEGAHVSNNVKKFHSLDILHQKINCISILEGPVAGHDKWEVNDLKDQFLL